MKIRIEFAAAAVAVAVLGVGGIAIQSAAGATATSDPTSNTAPSGLQSCNLNSAAISSACQAGALSDFNKARAKEGLPAMVLPSNFAALTVPQQLLVLTNIDRVDRGLPPFLGLSSALNSYAQQGAATASDPQFPPWAMEGGGNWASPVNAFWSEFLWVYDDGYGSGNLDCSSATAPGCWGHRHNVLHAYGSQMLAGFGTDSQHGDAGLYLGYDSHDTADAYSWADETTYFPAGSPENPGGSPGPTPTVVPNAPTGVTASVGDRTATVRWSPGTSNGSTITGYRATSNDGIVLTVAGTATSAHFTGLVNGRSYTFSVVAVSADGESAASASSAAVHPYGVPLAPRSIKYSYTGRTVTITWSAAGSNGAAITKYLITLQGRAYFVGPTVRRLRHTFSGPTTTTAAVAAYNARGRGPAISIRFRIR